MSEVVPLWATLLAALAGGALLVCAYAYVGYPLLARLLPRRRRAEAGPAELPRISVLVAAHNEAAFIQRRVENLLEQDYPAERLEVLVVSDASDDGTDEIVAAFDDPRVRLLRQEPRQGKTAGINRLAPMATGELLVQTDANALFAPDTIRALAETFSDPRVGVAIGEVSFTNEEDPLVASGEGLYWRFETWTKHVESERGLLAVANGAVYALRRELWSVLPEQIAGDAAEPLLAAREGYDTVVVPRARAFERAAASHGEEYARKVRIIAQQVACAGWIGLWRLPLRTAFAYVSHKLLRYGVPFLASAALVLAAVAAQAGSLLGLLVLAAVALPLLAAPLGLIPWPGILGRVLRVPLYLLVINVAAASGVLRGLRGRAVATWEVPRSTRVLS